MTKQMISSAMPRKFLMYRSHLGGILSLFLTFVFVATLISIGFIPFVYFDLYQISAGYQILIFIPAGGFGCVLIFFFYGWLGGYNYPGDEMRIQFQYWPTIFGIRRAYIHHRMLAMIKARLFNTSSSISIHSREELNKLQSGAVMATEFALSNGFDVVEVESHLLKHNRTSHAFIQQICNILPSVKFSIQKIKLNFVQRLFLSFLLKRPYRSISVNSTLIRFSIK